MKTFIYSLLFLLSSTTYSQLTPHSDFNTIPTINPQTGGLLNITRITATFIPNGQPPSTVDPVTSDGKRQVFIWRKQAGEAWVCSIATLNVDPNGGTQTFEIDVNAFQNKADIDLEYRPWYKHIVRIYTNGVQPFIERDGATNSDFGFTLAGFGTNIAQVNAGKVSGLYELSLCGGVPPHPIVLRRRASKPPPTIEPCKQVIP